MRSPLSLIVSFSVLLAIALLLAVIGLAQDPDSDGVGRDTFGLHSHGYRGALELLEAVGVDATRRIAPPAEDMPVDASYVLLAPTPPYIAREPMYLKRLVEWVERGGRIVVAPVTAATRQRFERFGAPTGEDEIEADLLETLGLGSVQVRENGTENSGASTSSRLIESRAQRATNLHDYVGPNGEELNLSLVAGEPFVLDLADEADEWRPVLQRAGAEQSEGVLAAAFPRGEGEIVLVADPDLFANGLLGQGDNSVAVVKLLSPAGGPVVFDEHYHGLSMRGNALYLLTVPGFAALTLSLLAAAGVWAWRTATPLGPPVITPAKPRRDLREYVDAMSHLLLRGRDGRRFLLRELRQGTLEELGRQLGLAALTPTPARIAAAMARRDRPRAEAFTSTIDAIDRRLDTPGRLGIAETTQLMQKANTCL